MKKIFVAILCLGLLFSCACSAGNDSEAEKIPPAFTVLQNQMKMTKHSEKDSSVSFSKQEFVDFFGEEFDYIVINTLPENGNLLCNGKSVIKGQTIPASELDYLKYLPYGDAAYAFFGFNTDSNPTAKDIFCEILFKDNENSPPIVMNGSTETVAGISCNGKLAINEPNGDKYTLNIIAYPTEGFLEIDQTGNFKYTPKDGFYGNDRIVYSVTDMFGSSSENATHEILVEENKSGIVFADMSENENHLYAYRMCEGDAMVYRYEQGNYYFDPDASVSKMDFLVMLMCVSKLDKDITAVADSVVDDDTGLSSGLKGYLSAAYEMGLIELKDGKFSPKENITSADAVFMVSKVLNLPGSVDAMAPEGESVLQSIGVASGVFENIADWNIPLSKSETAKLLYRVEKYIKENNIRSNEKK